jgi:glycyl-tRNA synthetase beta chain
MAELLLELFSEEIPARMQAQAAADLAQGLERGLAEAGLDHGGITTGATPRRLTVIVEGLASRQPDVEIERRGPRVGAPEAALEGFKNALGVADYRLEEQDDKKGKFYVARFQRAGKPTIELLGPMIEGLLGRFPWPKSMRWGPHEVRWVRPLHRILCLLDGTVVPLAFGPVAAGSLTEGHRFHARGPLEVKGVADYRAQLAAAKVVLDPAERRARIQAGAERLAAEAGLRLRHDPGLLDEVAGLVEWPVPLLGRIDASFMELPREVLVTSMRQHQKYLALEDEAGQLSDRFVVVANLEAADGGQAIVAGNERVLRARLWDARFFWDQDRRRRLIERVPALDGVVFHAALGSLGAKVRRIEALAAWLAVRIEGADPQLTARAARLCKADLSTGMVGEFPELQGVMGRYYAVHDGEPPEVAAALGEHYAPQGPSDACPKAPVSVAVALADKLDTLAGFFAIGEKPTGSKDPFALRRAALGVIRLILENKLRLPLVTTFEVTLVGYREQLPGLDRPAIAQELLAFFADRLKVHLRSAGVRHDLISAVFALEGEDDLVRLLAKVEALQAFLATEDGANLLIAHRRAGNIVRIEEKRDRRRYVGAPDPALLGAEEASRLLAGLESARAEIGRALQAEAFGQAMQALAGLRRPIDAFFDRVTVNADDPDQRENRLRLLGQIRAALDAIADFSMIEDTIDQAPNRRVA